MSDTKAETPMVVCDAPKEIAKLPHPLCTDCVNPRPADAQGVADAPVNTCAVCADEFLELQPAGSRCGSTKCYARGYARLRAERDELDGDLKDKTQECADVSRLLEITHKRLLEANEEAANRNASLASENERAERYLREALALEKQLAEARAEMERTSATLGALSNSYGKLNEEKVALVEKLASSRKQWRLFVKAASLIATRLDDEVDWDAESDRLGSARNAIAAIAGALTDYPDHTEFDAWDWREATDKPAARQPVKP